MFLPCLSFVASMTHTIVDLSSAAIDHEFISGSRFDAPTPQRKEISMNRAFALVLLTFSTIALAQVPRLKSGATVYVEPMGGYETYLAAALVKKQVPVVVVTDKAKAEYIIRTTVSRNVPSGPAMVVNNSATVNEGDSPNQQAWNQGWASGQQAAARRAALGSSDVSIAVIDAKTDQIVFAHSAGKGGTNQLQKTAEDCAKHLKEFIEKSEKAKK
jgi:hypothetical protein